LTYADLAEALQARLHANREAERHSLRNTSDSGERRRIEILEAQIAILQDAIATTEALGEQQRQEAGLAAKRVEALEADVATLKDTVTKAHTLAEQRRQEAETACKRAEILEAHFAQVAIGINLAIMMGQGQSTGFDVKRLQGIVDSIAGLRSSS
jgi:chromosome segregation ATPase